MHHIDNGELVPKSLPQEKQVVPQEVLVLLRLLLRERAALEAPQAPQGLRGQAERAGVHLRHPVAWELAFVGDSVGHRPYKGLVDVHA